MHVCTITPIHKLLFIRQEKLNSNSVYLDKHQNKTKWIISKYYEFSLLHTLSSQLAKGKPHANVHVSGADCLQ